MITIMNILLEQGVNDSFTTIISQNEKFFDLFLSAFLGFLSALIVEWIKDYVSSKRKRKQILINLLKELENIEVESTQLDKTKTYPYPYPIALWKGLCHSGSIVSLDKLDNYTKIISLFEEIEEANCLENECFEILMIINQSSQKDTIIKTLLESRERINSKVKTGIELLKEEL